MNFIHRHKGKITSLILVIILLAASYFFGGESPAKKAVPEVSEKVTATKKPVPEKEQDSVVLIKAEKTDEEVKEEEKAEKTEAIVKQEEKAEKTEAIVKQEEKAEKTEAIVKQEEKAEAIAEKKDEKVALEKKEPPKRETEEISDKELTCTISVVCNTLLTNKERLDSEKSNLVPSDGVIFSEKEVVFYEGESVFNILMREMKKAKIHMEYTSAPIYNSAYIEGIANLYEFDCGELSGWMYKVNGWFPNYGCSRYQLKAGDKIEWVYTCDLGKDVGGEYSARNGYENE